MKQTIPKAPLWLGLAGLLPFIWGAASHANPNLAAWGTNWAGIGFVGLAIQTTYGAVILSFMSGVLWGFATKTHGRTAAWCYVLSVSPALWAFFLMSSPKAQIGPYLIAGFLGLFILDIVFFQLQLTPNWWLRLRLLLTTIVLTCLLLPLWLT